MSAPESDDVSDDEAEVVDALPVTAGEAAGATPAPVPLTRASTAATVRSVPVSQAAAVAATGFAVGAVTAAVVRGLTRRRAVKTVTRRRSKGGPPVLGTRSFLVDVHLLGPRD